MAILEISKFKLPPDPASYKETYSNTLLRGSQQMISRLGAVDTFKSIRFEKRSRGGYCLDIFEPLGSFEIYIELVEGSYLGMNQYPFTIILNKFSLPEDLKSFETESKVIDIWEKSFLSQNYNGPFLINLNGLGKDYDTTNLKSLGYANYQTINNSVEYLIKCPQEN
jgi:hypothetical protein